MTIAELTRRLVEAGASPEVIAIAVEAVTLSRVTESDSERDRVRKLARARQRRRRQKIHQNKANAEANDAAHEPEKQRYKQRDTVTSTPELCRDESKGLFSSNGFEETTKKVKKEKKEKSSDPRARGTRIPENWQPSDDDRQFALDHGCDPTALREEFYDYWASVPGQRGRKIDWSATWRNRVRDVGNKRGHRNGNGTGPQGRNPGRRSPSVASGAIFTAMADLSREFAEHGEPRPGDDDVSAPGGVLPLEQ